MSRCQPDEIRIQECQRIWKFKIIPWSGNSTNEGLNLRAGMQSHSSRNRRRRCGENQPSRCVLLSVEPISRLLLYENLHRFTTKGYAAFSLVWPSLTCGQPLPGLFFVYFKENSNVWIGLLGGLAWTACKHFTEGSVFGKLPLSILQRLTMRWHSAPSERIKSN